MPPEALTAKPKYTSKLDIYSDGVLIIHTLCGRWTLPEDVFRPDPQNPDAMIPVSEVERRAEYLQEIGNDHPLMGLIHQCLSNMPAQRSEAPALLEWINTILSTPSQLFTNRVEMLQWHITSDGVWSIWFAHSYVRLHTNTYTHPFLPLSPSTLTSVWSVEGWSWWREGVWEEDLSFLFSFFCSNYSQSAASQYFSFHVFIILGSCMWGFTCECVRDHEHGYTKYC